jgi:hypothetical protein
MANGQTRDSWDWKAVGQYFGVTDAHIIPITQYFLPRSATLTPLLLDHQWIYVSDKLVNQVNRSYQE